MKNLNIAALEHDGTRFWGFEGLGTWFRYHFTANGLILRPSNFDDPEACSIVDGRCYDRQLFAELMARGFEFGTFLPSAGEYIGLTDQEPDCNLQDLVDEYNAIAEA